MQSILVIEDNAAIRENTAELLELSGYKVLTEPNGSTGFTTAKATHPDVIICDIMMPETDGLRFLKLIKSDYTTANIPLIFFSAGSAPAGVKKKIEPGADIYLSKPFTDEDLLSAVTQCLSKKN
ncbi:MAG: response regulator [Chitinophagales bacterium]|nr:response regulator [Chitinophagales bacterium]